jgi:hypothetical protein
MNRGAIHRAPRFSALSGQTATAELLEKENESGYGFEVLTKPLIPGN